MIIYVDSLMAPTICTSRVLVVFLLGSILVSGQVTNGPSGDLCPEDPDRKCIAGQSICVGNKCRCHAPYVNGIGNFQCYLPLFLYGELKNDPRVRTFAGEKVDVPLPCRYLVTDVQNEFRKPSGKVVGYCTLQVYSYGFKVRGKFFIYGFDALIRVVKSPPGKSRVAGIRVYGTAEHGVYTFTEYGKESDNDLDPWGPPVDVNAFGQQIKTVYDAHNNWAILELIDCGFRVAFRPADLHQGKNQLQVPGLTVAVRSCENLVWNSLDKVIALPPFGKGPTVGQVAMDLDLAPEEAFLVRALNGGALQDFPDASDVCLDVVATLASCTDKEARKEAVESCSFMLRRPRFVRCWSRDAPEFSDDVLDIFNRCVNALCHKKIPECEDVVEQVASSPCAHEAMSELTGFDCMFP